MEMDKITLTSSHIPEEWNRDLLSRILETIENWREDYKKEFNDEPVKVISSIEE